MGLKKGLRGMGGLLILSVFAWGCSQLVTEDVAHEPEEIIYASDSRALAATSDVLLQGFHWNTWRYNGYDIIRNNAAAIANAGFNMVWFPPPSASAAVEGYLPSQWYNMNSSYGNYNSLKSAISALRQRGVRAIADIVINHRVGSTNWADFSNPAFADNRRAVTRNDEWGQGTGNWDTGDGFHAARDLDHTYWSVQQEIRNWMNWLKNDLGFSGWRYDYVKGFNGSYVKNYNDATRPTFSVGELWPDITGNYYASYPNTNYHRQRLMDWINATGATSAAFDFTTKWQLMLATSRSEYWRMGSVPGAIGWWPAMSVTFVDNHDTGPSPGPGGGQNHWSFQGDKVEQAYAYILTHPGIPSVYWTHFFDWGSTLRNRITTLISLRKERGIRSNSSISVQAADGSKYAAIVNGTNGQLAVKIGWGSWSPGGGWALRASGNQWAVWSR